MNSRRIGWEESEPPLASSCFPVFIERTSMVMTESGTRCFHHTLQPKPLVYVVDDEAMLLELATVILEPLGFQISTFRDPESALKSFANANPKPDLIITDYAMNSMNGMDLIRECRRIVPEQKILLLSGTVGMEVFRQAPSKPDQFLAKPYHARQLVDLVREMLAGSC